MQTEIETLQALLQKDPSNFQARRELSIMLANNGFNEEALSNLQYLLKYFPEDAELLYNIGILQEKLKDFQSAKISYEKAIEIMPQDDFYYNLGEVLVTLEEWDSAINAFNSVLQNDSNDGNCYFNIGLCYLNKKETNKAIDFFQRAVELNPKDIYALFNLGNIYQNIGLTNFAVENYKKVLEITPDYSWAYFNLASIAYQNENFEEAKDYLLKTIQYNNQDIEAYKLLTKILVKNEEIEEVITLLETRLSKEENGDIYYMLSQVYKYVRKEDDYIEALENALDNYLTLSYPKDIVKKELERVSKNSNSYSTKEDLEEYNNYEEDEEDSDFDEEDFEIENFEDEDVEEDDFDDDKDEYQEDDEE